MKKEPADPQNGRNAISRSLGIAACGFFVFAHSAALGGLVVAMLVPVVQGRADLVTLIVQSFPLTVLCMMLLWLLDLPAHPADRSSATGTRRRTRIVVIHRGPGQSPARNEAGREEPEQRLTPFPRRLASFLHCEEKDLGAQVERESRMKFWCRARILGYIGPKSARYIRFLLQRIRRLVHGVPPSH